MEALAGPASVITVASLAIQVCEELKKVHEFWQSVKEAPDDVAHVSTEINLFLAWLAIIANNYQRQGLNHKSPTEAAATETLKVCLATAHDMNGVVKHVESGYSKGSLTRRWASVKFVFRKDKTGKIMAQIERMKALLIMVQNCYLGDMQEAGFKSLSLSLRPEDHPLQTTDIEHSFNTTTTASADEDLVIETRPLQPTPESLVELVSFSPTASPPAPRRPKHRTKNQERAYNFGLAMLRLVATDQESIFFEESGKERRIFSRTIRYDLRLAQWLSSRGLSWYPFGIYGNWKENLRTFRYVPQDSLIVDFCVEGDLANVQRMFDKRMASPFDRVDRGFRGDWSLLHFAIANCHTQLCKFLIECGLGRSSASGISE
ncbi:hypothetical protein HO173_010614 [Letharia columbiana]|uniref:Ankyrin repeat protein n=1 Tax=Letharia columbiana TaxID=112416 RepID=A0A8H6FM83_9LECA|nr:uncharacterized protein HO173_010614 [Letharia columbiana]KAF6231114.1 hypothetical protein HO173_010614 [Letharia columbiana]